MPNMKEIAFRMDFPATPETQTHVQQLVLESLWRVLEGHQVTVAPMSEDRAEVEALIEQARVIFGFAEEAVEFSWKIPLKSLAG